MDGIEACTKQSAQCGWWVRMISKGDTHALYYHLPIEPLPICRCRSLLIIHGQRVIDAHLGPVHDVCCKLCIFFCGRCKLPPQKVPLYAFFLRYMRVKQHWQALQKLGTCICCKYEKLNDVVRTRICRKQTKLPDPTIFCTRVLSNEIKLHDGTFFVHAFIATNKKLLARTSKTK